VDTLGLVLRVFVTAALGSVKGRPSPGTRVKQMGKAVSGLHTIWVDGALTGTVERWWDGLPLDCTGSATTGTNNHATRVLKKRACSVERTLGWLVWCRRLNKDYYIPQTLRHHLFS